ncbi:MAG: chitobiase/beta-hexosaminidase C-terminal domain-containing protein, partial [Planctomycetota bacterium]|nr:chitobiase/beta-hexosaminidase C-terminal domain-containing protein [Planctomycetota bacterium]
VARVRAAVPGALVAVPAGGDVRRVPSGVLVRDEADGAWRLPLTEAELPRQSEDLEQLLLDTLGQGANLGLIVRPAPDGSVGEATAQRLADLHDNLAAILDVDLVRAAEVQASHTHSEAHGAANVQDGDPLSAWMVPGDVRRCFLTCAELPRTVLDTIVLAEPLERGACITSYRLQGLRDNLWLDLHVGDRIGPRRVLRVDPSDYQSLRLIVTDATAAPAIASIEAYAAPPRVHIEAEEQVFLGGTRVRFFTSHPSAVVRYTLDGSEPTRASSLYRRALDLDQSCVVTARAFTGDEPGQYSATLRLRAYTYATLAAPVPSEPTTAGLRTRVWDGPWRDLDQVPWEREPVVDRTVETIGPDGHADHEGAVQRFDGYVRAHKDGIYGFFSPGAGHVRVYLGDDLVLESFTGLDRVGEVGLQAGWHPLRIELIRAGALRTSSVQWRGPSLSKRPFLPRELRRD